MESERPPGCHHSESPNIYHIERTEDSYLEPYSSREVLGHAAPILLAGILSVRALAFSSL